MSKIVSKEAIMTYGACIRKADIEKSKKRYTLLFILSVIFFLISAIVYWNGSTNGKDTTADGIYLGVFFCFLLFTFILMASQSSLASRLKNTDFVNGDRHAFSVVQGDRKIPMDMLAEIHIEHFCPECNMKLDSENVRYCPKCGCDLA